jgi:hypothetical protein
MVMKVWTYRDSTVRGLDLTGFEVEAIDGMLGRVERMSSDATGGYLVVDAGTLAPLGGRVLLPAGVVDSVDLDAERVFVRLTRDEIRRAPAYDWQVPLEQRHRDEFAAYYGAERPEPAIRRAPRGRPQRAAETPSRSQRSSRRSSTGRGRARVTRGDERTKQELYDQAKKLGLEGRSKMSKAELARAIERHGGRASKAQSSAKANPVEVQKFLEGVGYPTRTTDLVKEARSQGASGEVRKTLERLPEKRFKTPTEVSEAIGKLR